MTVTANYLKVCRRSARLQYRVDRTQANFHLPKRHRVCKNMLEKENGFDRNMDRDHALEIANRLLWQNGLIDWTVKLNRNKRRLGTCKEYVKRIELSELYVERNSISHVTDTVLHEIAHALVGAKHGHDDVWKAMCARLGCTPKACENDVDMPVGDWSAQCKSCKHVFNRHRKPVSLRGMYCLKCGPENGRLSFSNPKLKYQQLVEKTVDEEKPASQLMLKLF